MKLTEENADYMDCRPLRKEPLDVSRLPEHLRGREAARQEAEAASQKTSQKIKGDA